MAVVIKFTNKEAELLGLLVCSSCGFPRNNHFNFGDRKCAHTKACFGYKPKAKIGKLVKAKATK